MQWGRTLMGICVGVLLWTTTVHAILIRGSELILDTTTGLRWAPVSSVSGALAIEDLPPGLRYATEEELNALLNTYVVNLPEPCDFNGSFPCTPATYQAIVDFVDIFRAEPRFSPFYSLLGVYGPTGGDPPFGIAMFLTLAMNDQVQTVYLDRQSTHYPPIRGDFGMFLVSPVPEPSTFALWCGAVVVLMLFARKTN